MEIIEQHWVAYPALIEQNFDANGSPCDEPGRHVVAELSRTIMPEPLTDLLVHFTIDFTGRSDLGDAKMGKL